MAGNLDPHLFPSGARDDGPVDPWQPPITIVQSLKNLWVQNGKPGTNIVGTQS